MKTKIRKMKTKRRNPIEDFVTTAFAAQLLGVSTERVDALLHAGSLAGARIDGVWHVSSRSALAYAHNAKIRFF